MKSARLGDLVPRGYVPLKFENIAKGHGHEGKHPPDPCEKFTVIGPVDDTSRAALKDVGLPESILSSRPFSSLFLYAIFFPFYLFLSSHISFRFIIFTTKVMWPASPPEMRKTLD